PLSFGHNDDLEPYPYDPDKARQLLAEAGYPNGFTFELSVEDKRRDVAEAYAFMLSQIGVTARVRVWGDYNSMVEAMRRGELDAMMTDWGDSTMDRPASSCPSCAPATGEITVDTPTRKWTG